jgi:hypothetical protein
MHVHWIQGYWRWKASQKFYTVSCPFWGLYWLYFHQCASAVYCLPSKEGQCALCICLWVMEYWPYLEYVCCTLYTHLGIVSTRDKMNRGFTVVRGQFLQKRDRIDSSVRNQLVSSMLQKVVLVSAYSILANSSPGNSINRSWFLLTLWLLIRSRNCVDYNLV